jgi:hypothetical protein
MAARRINALFASQTAVDLAFRFNPFKVFPRWPYAWKASWW